MRREDNRAILYGGNQKKRQSKWEVHWELNMDNIASLHDAPLIADCLRHESDIS
jgi:hypothetical protein